MDIGVPPAQDSPKHILNALNDDCIQSVFRQLDNLRDFLSAAETCIRFQENAKLTFRTQYKTIEVDEFSKKENMSSNSVTVDRLQSLFSIFGPLIVEFHFEGIINDDILNMIADYCGKTLQIFKITSSNVVDFNTRSSFKALTELRVINANIQNFKYKSQLRILTIDRNVSDFDWFIQPFPLLETLKLVAVCHLRLDQAIEFLKLNPQLKSLYIRSCRHITPHIYGSIVDHAPKIEKLFLSVYKSTSTADSIESILNVSKLRNLRFLGIFYSQVEVPVGRLIDSLVENNVPVEVLGILNCDTDLIPQTSNLNIAQMKQLKKLGITQMSDETLVNYVKHLPQLEEMICAKQLSFLDITQKITVAGIKRALQCGEHLTVLSVDTKDLIIDLDDFKSILSLAKKKHVEVTIIIENGKIDVPNEILKANRKWVNIETHDKYVNFKSIHKISHWFLQA